MGGSDYLAHLADAVPTAANAVSYAEIVHQKAVLRRVIMAGTQIAQLGYDAGGRSAEDIVNLAQAQMYEVGVGRVRQDYMPIGSVVEETLNTIQNIQDGTINRGVPTGFRDIDDVTQGLQPGQMIIVAGRPAMGKSTLAVDFARSAALHHGLATIVFSLEMSREQLGMRLLSTECLVDNKKLHKYDGAFYSKMSMNGDGGAKGTGVLTIDAENEGLDSELHLTINGGTITTGFGRRNRPTAGASSYHYGVDIGVGYGTPIMATRAGRVTYAGWNGGYGYMVQIDHGDGVVTRSGHCSRVLVSTGQYVSQGAQIALVGSTGVSTGNHLHFEVRVNGTAQDPRNYVNF